MGESSYETLVESVERHGLPGSEMMKTIWDMLIEKGMDQGIKQGIEQGIKQGIAKGIEQGKISLILKVLENRFNADRTAYEAKLATVQAIAALDELGIQASTSQTLVEFDQQLALVLASPDGQNGQDGR